jgi:hypothetical protein
LIFQPPATLRQVAARLTSAFVARRQSLSSKPSIGSDAPMVAIPEAKRGPQLSTVRFVSTRPSPEAPEWLGLGLCCRSKRLRVTAFFAGSGHGVRKEDAFPGAKDVAEYGQAALHVRGGEGCPLHPAETSMDPVLRLVELQSTAPNAGLEPILLSFAQSR